MPKIQYPALCVLIYSILLVVTSCGNKNRAASGAVWGTCYNVVYLCDVDMNDSIIEAMNHVGQELSMFDEGSTVSLVNRNECDLVGADFITVFEISKKISSLSNGAFDPTVASLTNLWGFGPKRTRTDYIPNEQEVDSALQYVGMEACEIADGKVLKKNPQTCFDFSAVAKGYGVDAVARMLERNGCTNHLVEIGGEIRASGKNGNGLPWRVQIDAPSSGENGHDPLYLIELSNASVATSGNYRNFRTVGNAHFVHTLNPKTGYPIQTDVLSATVITHDCATADALATACMAMNAEDAIDMIERYPDAEALLVVASSDSMLLLRSTKFPPNVSQRH